MEMSTNEILAQIAYLTEVAGQVWHDYDSRDAALAARAEIEELRVMLADPISRAAADCKSEEMAKACR